MSSFFEQIPRTQGQGGRTAALRAASPASSAACTRACAAAWFCVSKDLLRSTGWLAVQCDHEPDADGQRLHL